jgi:two-component system chemotaxis response regulator CheB
MSAAAERAIVLAASAGGIAALRTLLPGLSAGPAAVLVLIHTASQQVEGLLRVLQEGCSLPVSAAIHGEPAQAGRVYVAPPRYHLLVEADRCFALSVDPKVCHVRPSADVLLGSAADAWRADLAAAILTGSNPDGAEGLAQLRSRGGYALVQRPDTAERPEMPAAALARAGADAILPLSAIAPALMRWCGAGLR